MPLTGFFDTWFGWKDLLIVIPVILLIFFIVFFSEVKGFFKDKLKSGKEYKEVK